MNIQTLLAKVKEMRQAQKDFFRLTYEAKKDPFKYEERKRVLAESKALEKEVDGMLDEQITLAQMTDDEQVEYKQPKS